MIFVFVQIPNQLIKSCLRMTSALMPHIYIRIIDQFTIKQVLYSYVRITLCFTLNLYPCSFKQLECLFTQSTAYKCINTTLCKKAHKCSMRYISGGYKFRLYHLAVLYIVYFRLDYCHSFPYPRIIMTIK